MNVLPDQQNSGTATVLHPCLGGGVIRQSNSGSPESPNAALHHRSKSMLLSDSKSPTPN